MFFFLKTACVTKRNMILLLQSQHICTPAENQIFHINLESFTSSIGGGEAYYFTYLNLPYNYLGLLSSFFFFLYA